LIVGRLTSLSSAIKRADNHAEFRFRKV